MEKISQRIRQKRTELGLTMQELGDMVGVQSSAVNKWEKGMVTNLKRETIQKLADIFDVSPVWLLGYEEAENRLVNYYKSMINLNGKYGDFIIKYAQAPEHIKDELIKYYEFLCQRDSVGTE